LNSSRKTIRSFAKAIGTETYRVHWLAVYDKEDERKLRLRLGLFEEATVNTGHKWKAIDLTDAFANWMFSPQTASVSEQFFKSPKLLDDGTLGRFNASIVNDIKLALAELPDPENTVLALYGIASLFGFLKISEILPMVERELKGRLSRSVDKRSEIPPLTAGGRTGSNVVSK
jgi:hypothetical protein